MDSNPVALYHHVLDDALKHPRLKGIPQSVIMDHNRPLSDFSDPGAVAIVALLRSIVKKYPPTHSTSQLKDAAIAAFKDSDRRCAEWVRTDHALFGYVLDEMRATAYRELSGLDWQVLLRSVRSGPGASVSSRGRNSFLEKFFINPLTATNRELYSEYRNFMWQKPQWAHAELVRRSLAGSVVDVVRGSNLTTVPKNSSTDRTICTEPSLNMMFQLCLGDAINSALRRHYGYDPALQPDRNRASACHGSVTGGTATIDLKSASDTISMKFVEFVLPDDWVAAIHDCRSPETQINGQWYSLNMVSSMGNGFTFPLQTYLFSLAIKCLCKTLSLPWERYDSSLEFGVFGDDIVVPSSLYIQVCGLLTSLGFIVNESKSFALGCFRESCGTDWFRGHDVRGVYCQGLSQDPDRYSLINRLNRWSAKHRCPLPSTISYLLPPGWRRFTVPYDEDDTAGVKGFLKLRRGGIFRYTALKQRKRLVSLYHGDRLKEQFANPYGVMLAASAGSLSSSGVGRRVADAKYYPVRLFTPNNSIGVSVLSRDGIASNRDWEDTLFLNLPIRETSS